MTKVVITTFFSESTKGRAEVNLKSDGYNIDYYSSSGDLIKSESFPGKSVHYVEDAAENWALGVKPLFG